MKKRILSIILTLTMLAMAMVAFAGCGNEETLETFIDRNEDVAQSIKDMEYSDENGTVSVEAKDNVLIITSQYAEKMSDAAIENFKKEKSKTDKDSQKIFKDLIKSLEEASEVEGIYIRVDFVDREGKEIFSTEYR